MDIYVFSSFALLNTYWIFILPTHEKLRSVVLASSFSLLESSWYFFWTDTFYTSLWQFIMNIYFVPFFVSMYRMILISPRWRVALMPINIWTYEIVVGYYSIFLFGYNPAWDYKGCWFALFSDQIRLDYIFVWWALGVVKEAYFYCIELLILVLILRHGEQTLRLRRIKSERYSYIM